MARKRKYEGVPSENQVEVLPPARHVAPLRTPGDCTTEAKRIYRLAMNRKIGTDELTRFTYALEKIRAGLEADQPPEISQKPSGPFVDTVVVNGVPSGTFLPPAEIERLESQFRPPLPDPPPSKPMLKLFENQTEDAEIVPEPPQAA